MRYSQTSPIIFNGIIHLPFVYLQVNVMTLIAWLHALEV